MNSSVLSVQSVTSSVGSLGSAGVAGGRQAATHRRERDATARTVATVESSSWNLPAADEFQFDLRLPHGGVERA